MANMSVHNDTSQRRVVRDDVDDDDEDECRVCRGPAEDGHPLFKPCKCSGSIGLTHQDCLRQWLNVQRSGEDRCELCKTRFTFAPLFADDAPERLPAAQVFAGICRRAVASWFPFVLRCVFASSLWLIVAPLVTNYLYQAWMHRPGAVWDRLEWNLIFGDLVSGAVVVACVIVSFLSLMSFADFLRVELQQRGFGPRNNNNEIQDRNRLARQGPDEPVLSPSEADIDNELYVRAENELKREATRNDNKSNVRVDNQNETWNEDSNNRAQQELVGDNNQVHDVDNEVDDAEALAGQAMAEQFMQAVDEAPPRAVANHQNDVRADRNLDFDQDDAMDMDINIALDELLGVRGPLRAVVRNLVWLLAFNAVYLGFFTFFPRLVGTALLSAVFNTNTIKEDIIVVNHTISATNVSHQYLSFLPRFVRSVLRNTHIKENTTLIDFANSTTPLVNVSEMTSFHGIVSAIDAESIRLNTTFRLIDLVNVMVGYLVFAVAVVFMRSLWILSKKIRFVRHGRGRTGNVDLDDDFRLAFDEVNRRLGGNEMNQWADEQAIPLSLAIGLALDALTAIVKVGVLLLLKMFLLPIGLGLCLDFSTLTLFGADLETRVLYAGRDLFSFTLLHWVAGITFMLLVTVSVLQLREVAHPDLLAQVIRPQEPQPDLLGNLLHESVSTHSKRMVLSLIIYVALLIMHIYLPVRLLVQSGLFDVMSFLQFKTSYILMAELQVPLELLFFHLCMLGLLEKNKNSIGEIQHNWLRLLCRFLGLVECILPLSVDKFKYVGRRSLYIEESSNEIDPYWFKIAEDENGREDLINDSLKHFESSVSLCFDTGETKPSGERVLKNSSNFIRLPPMCNNLQMLREKSKLLPTNIGRFRLDRKKSYFYIWEEIPGDPIPRPPEGWDDLGAGGADEGRWAWGREKRSLIERGVAHRKYLFDGNHNIAYSFFIMCKLIILIFASWIATSLALCFLVIGPLSIGRFLFFVFRVPDDWIHDPFAFAFGSLVFYPSMRFVLAFLFHSDASVLVRFVEWTHHLWQPPGRKIIILVRTAVYAFIVAPLLVGYIVDIAMIKSNVWFVGKEVWFDVKSAILNWLAGIILLSTWARLCFLKFFTKGYWRAQEEEADGGVHNGFPVEDRVAARREAGANRLQLTWQGDQGRVAKFFHIWKSAFLNWEWDVVDEVPLLLEFTYPLIKLLVLVLSVPVLSILVCQMQSTVSSALMLAIVIRCALLLSCLFQIALVWQHEVLDWFEAAHKAARDDRFLIGEVLQDYEG